MLKLWAHPTSGEIRIYVNNKDLLEKSDKIYIVEGRHDSLDVRSFISQATLSRINAMAGTASFKEAATAICKQELKALDIPENIGFNELLKYLEK